MGKPTKIKKKQFNKLNNDRLDAEFKRARLDVFKFGVKHLNKKDRIATKYDQLVRLGAEVILIFIVYVCRIHIVCVWYIAIN